MNSIKKVFLSDKVVLCVVVANVIMIFLQQFEFFHRWFYRIDTFFTIFYVIEVAVKVKEYGRTDYFADRWNILDFVITLVTLPSILFIFMPWGANPLHFMVVLRTLRVFRLFKVMKFFPDINNLVMGVRNALRASGVVLIGFIVLLVIVSIFTCSMFQQLAPEYFANPIKSLYSIFRLFSLEGWYEIPDLIASRSSEVMAFFVKLYFVVVLFLGGILGLSLVNSIFVDAMVSDNNDELIKEVKKLREEVESLCRKLDKDELK